MRRRGRAVGPTRHRCAQGARLVHDESRSGRA
jgi:hypothetical protein